MSEQEETQKDKVRRIVASQSPDYLIHPNATAFVVEGLDESVVSTILSELEAEGDVRLDEIIAQTRQPKLDDEGNPIAGEFATDPVTNEPILEDVIGEDGKPVLFDQGWCITDAGKERYKNG